MDDRQIILQALKVCQVWASEIALRELNHGTGWRISQKVQSLLIENGGGTGPKHTKPNISLLRVEKTESCEGHAFDELCGPGQRAR